MSWFSKKQKLVSRSSIEAEYRSIAHTTFEILWIQSLLKELHVASVKSPTIYCDNISTTHVCANSKLHSKMKHISFDFSFCQRPSHCWCVSNIWTEDYLGDALTKLL